MEISIRSDMRLSIHFDQNRMAKLRNALRLSPDDRSIGKILFSLDERNSLSLFLSLPLSDIQIILKLCAIFSL